MKEMEQKMESRRARELRRSRQRRLRRIQRNIHLMLVTCILIAGLAFSLYGINSKAQSQNEKIQYKYYTGITVEYGDTLEALAQTYTEGTGESTAHYIQEVMHINHLEDTTIRSGQTLVIPYYSTELKGI